MLVGDAGVVEAADRHRQVLEQAVVQAVDPAVDDQRLAALPGVLHDGRLADVERLLDARSARTGASTRARVGQRLEPGGVPVAHVLTWRSQLSARPTRRSSSAALHAAAAGVADDDDVLDLQHVDGELDHRQAVEVGVDDDVGDVAMDEQLARARSTISLAGTRLSAQPIHRYFGACCWSRPLKKPGRAASIFFAQRRLFSSSSGRSDTAAVGCGMRRRAAGALSGGRVYGDRRAAAPCTRHRSPWRRHRAAPRVARSRPRPCAG